MIVHAVVASSLLTLLYSMHVINRMGRKTNHAIRIAFILIASGEFGMFLGPLFGLKTANEAIILILNFGLMVFMFCDHRHRRAIMDHPNDA